MFKKKLEIEVERTIDISVNDVVDMLGVKHPDTPDQPVSTIRLDFYGYYFIWEDRLECPDTGLKTLKETKVRFSEKEIIKAIRKRYPQVGKPIYFGLSKTRCDGSQSFRIVY